MRNLFVIFCNDIPESTEKRNRHSTHKNRNNVTKLNLWCLKFLKLKAAIMKYRLSTYTYLVVNFHFADRNQEIWNKSSHIISYHTCGNGRRWSPTMKWRYNDLSAYTFFRLAISLMLLLVQLSTNHFLFLTKTLTTHSKHLLLNCSSLAFCPPMLSIVSSRNFNDERCITVKQKVLIKRCHSLLNQIKYHKEYHINDIM